MATDSELSIVLTRRADATIWQKTWEECPWATFFESPDWAAVFVHTFGDVYELHPLEIAFSDGAVAIVPGVSGKRMRGRVKMLECSPGGTYGGPISVDNLQSRHLDLLINEVKSQFPNVSLRINPYLLSNLKNPGYSDGDFTQNIDLLLPEGPFNELFRKRRIFAYARKAKDLGYFIKPASVGHLENFHNLYVEASTQWGEVAKVYSLSFFRKLVESPMCDFLGCYDDSGELVGGGLFVRSVNHAISWLAIINPECKKKGIFDFFYYEVIFHYRNEGLKYFDFNPSGGIEGVVWFKDKFQPDRLPAPVIIGKSFLVKVVDSLNKIMKRYG